MPLERIYVEQLSPDNECKAAEDNCSRRANALASYFVLSFHQLTRSSADRDYRKVIRSL